MICISGKAVAQISAVPLVPGEDGPKLHQYLRYSDGYQGDIQIDALLSDVENFHKVNAPSIEFGFTEKPILVLLTFENVGLETDEWIFSMGRKSFHDLKVWEVGDIETNLILDNQNLSLVKDNTWRYMTLSVPLILEAGEDKTFAIIFEPKNAFHLPLNVRTPENYYHARRISDALTFGSVVGIIILVIVNLSFYIFTRMKGFIWLALAEAFYTLQIFSSSGYASYFSGYSDPSQGDFVGAIGKCAFCLFMTMFARDFISTKKNFPKTDIVFLSIILASIFTFVFSVGFHAFVAGPNIISLVISWILTLLISAILPFVAIRATFEIDRNFWPLIIAWTVFAFFILYGFLHTLDLAQVFPLVPELVGPVGLFEVLFASLALSLRIGGIQKNSIRNKERLVATTKEKLALSERSRSLAEERLNAINAIQDQNSLIHASGHDSKQVLFALNSALEMLNSNEHSISDAEFKSLLSSSAMYLEGIVTSTLSGTHLGGGGVNFLTLSSVSIQDLMRPLEMLYKKSFQIKTLSFEFDIAEDFYLVTDRALVTRAISNLLSNSLKFTDVGGVMVKCCVQGSNTIIEIIDSGKGMSSEMEERLNVGQYLRNKDNVEASGSGSGYSFAKKTVQALSGNISISNEKSGGVTVRLCLPCATLARETCSVDDLQQRLANHLLVDIDLPVTEDHLRNQSIPKVLVTYDDTALNRLELYDGYMMSLYKPLCLEIADHPIWSKRSDEPKLFGS